MFSRIFYKSDNLTNAKMWDIAVTCSADFRYDIKVENKVAISNLLIMSSLLSKLKTYL